MMDDPLVRAVRESADVALVLNARCLMRSLRDRSSSSAPVDDLAMLCALVSADPTGHASMTVTAIAGIAGLRHDDAAESMGRIMRSGYAETSGKSKGHARWSITPAGERTVLLFGDGLRKGPAESLIKGASPWLLGRAFTCTREAQPTNRELVLVGHLIACDADEMPAIVGLCPATVARHDGALEADGLACEDADGRCALTLHGFARAVSAASTIQSHLWATGFHDDVDHARALHRHSQN